MADRPVEDAEQLEARRARTLLELAGDYTRQVLQVPEDLATLRAVTAEVLFELAWLRHELARLRERVEALEKGGRR